MTIRTNEPNRKELVRRVAEFTGEPVRYLGAPTFSYKTGGFEILRDGTIEGSCASDERELLQLLTYEGLAGQEEEGAFEISVPADGMDGNALRNLVYMVYAEQYLLNKAAGHADFRISDDLIEWLKGRGTVERDELSDRLATQDCKGLKLTAGKVTFRFSISAVAAKNRAYAELAALMTAHAGMAKKIIPKRKEPENEKYYFRIWLLRIGMEGRGGKESRKALLSGLKGRTAFRTPADAEKHKARLRAGKE